ncbi:MAG: N-methyl-L-tryptophan oxidase [Thermodesulfobacteriota bacterium]|jgi:sarcosine oxidase
MAVNTCDVVVAGLGAMGSAIAFHLTRRNVRVVGLDRFTPPHARGSSHGESRIIRQAYFEHPAYVPLVLRAYELWRELEGSAAGPLLRITGGVVIGPRDGDLVRGALRSARQHNLIHEVLSAAEVRARFPAFDPAGGVVGVYEPRAGVLFPEACVRAHLAAARRRGAVLRSNEPLIRWRPSGDGVEVRTPTATYSAAGLVLCVGPWLPGLLPSLPLQVERQVFFVFRPLHSAPLFSPERCPVSIWELPSGHSVYGIPDLGRGVKVGRHHGGEVTTAETVRRRVEPDEVRHMRALLAQYLPAANGDLLDAAVCLYTNTPDTHFVLDRHPACPAVWLVSPCSGHGFEFASVIGEVTADLFTTGATPYDLSLFRVQRLLR